MKKLIVFALFLGIIWSCTQPEKEAEVAAPVPQAVEFADTTYIVKCKEGLAFMTAGDMDGFVKNFAENGIYRFNNGDSIAGKAAITAYWKDRRANSIDKIEFSNDVWLSLRINESTGIPRKGNWVLSWYNVAATYKTGKSMSQWIHTVYHFDDNGNIDEVIQYLDRVPIMAAQTK